MPPTLGATGIGVSDLKQSTNFYTKVLNIGLKPVQYFDVESYKEVVLAFPPGPKPTGSSILLMEYKNAPKPKYQQGKLVFYVDSVEEIVGRCKRHGCEILKELGTGDGAIKDIALIGDPDGFCVELIPLKARRAWASMGDKAKI